VRSLNLHKSAVTFITEDFREVSVPKLAAGKKSTAETGKRNSYQRMNLPTLKLEGRQDDGVNGQESVVTLKSRESRS